MNLLQLSRLPEQDREITLMHIQLDNQTILLAFVAVTGLAVLLQAFVLLGILVSVRKSARALLKEAESMRASIMPVLSTALPILQETQEILIRIAPKVELVAADVSDLTYRLRIQAAEIQDSAAEIVERVRIQAARMDAMCTDGLDAVDRAGSYVAGAVLKPMRQVSGVLASVRAVVGSLRSTSRDHR